ncbi:MAG: polyprenyl diphosphate synthase [Candidatus Aenigmatarchaeota archaeon]
MTDDVEGNSRGLHIAIIPDGNRRYARRHGMPVWWGHMKGAQKLKEVSGWCLKEPDVGMVSVYALSTENLKRSKEELDKLWEIYNKEFTKLVDDENIRKQGLRIRIVGNSGMWRKDVKQAAKDLMSATRTYSRGVLNILLAYGSQFEIVNSAVKLAAKGLKTVPPVEESFKKFLMVNQPVDLIIRTGGEHRLSNFLLYQSAYAEIYFSDTLWPDFSKKEFRKILDWYRNRERRIGR